MLLAYYLEHFLSSVMERWEKVVGELSEEQWEEASEAVRLYFMNVLHKLSQLYILLRVHCTPLKSHTMGLRPARTCPKCCRDRGDLKNLLWLHKYWV